MPDDRPSAGDTSSPGRPHRRTRFARAYGLLGLWVLGRRRLVAIGAAVVGLVAALLALPPTLDTDLISLLPRDEPAAEAIRALSEETQGVNFVVFTFLAEDDERAIVWLDELTAELQALDSITFAMHRVEPELAYHVGLMQLDPEVVREFDLRLRGALALGPALNPMVLGPLLDMEYFAERIAEADHAELLDGVEGRHRVVILPTSSNLNQDFSMELMDDIRAVIADSDPQAAGMSLVWTAGPHVYTDEAVRGIRHDIAATGLVSVLLVLGILVVAFQSWKAPLLVFPPLILANLVNLALVVQLFGSLNTYTSFGSALLVGLGIDFAVHLTGRYREERSRGQSVEEAVRLAWEIVGPPCATAALTSSAAFLALTLARFQGLAQLGVAMATGLVLCLVAMLVVLPVLLPYIDPPAPRLAGRVPAWLGRGYRRTPIVLAAVLALTAGLAVVGLPRLAFDYDFTAMQVDHRNYGTMDEQTRDLVREAYPFAVVSYDSRDQLAREHARVSDLVQAGELPHIRAVLSIETLLPSDQDQRVAALTGLARSVHHPNLRYLPRPLVDKLLPLRDWEPRARTSDDFPEGLQLLVGAGRSRQHLLLSPTGDLYDMRNSAALWDELVAHVDQPACELLIQGAIYRSVIKDLPLIGLMSLLIVTVLAFIDLRSPLRAVATIAALLVGMVWAGSALGLLGIQLTLMNVVGLPLMLGIGVDVVIHLAHRLAEEGRGRVLYVLSTTGVAALTSTVTTAASFLSLTAAANGGVRSLGWLVVVGLFAVTAASATLLALGWAWSWQLRPEEPPTG